MRDKSFFRCFFWILILSRWESGTWEIQLSGVDEMLLEGIRESSLVSWKLLREEFFVLFYMYSYHIYSPFCYTCTCSRSRSFVFL